MSRVDVHPEELIDAARRGELDPAGERRLDAHLEHCTACSAELAVGGDFAAELEPKDGDQALIAGLVTGALGQVGLPATATGEVAKTAAGTTSTATKGLLLKVAGTALAAGVLGGAVAALWMTGAFDADPEPRAVPDETPAVAPPSEERSPEVEPVEPAPAPEPAAEPEPEPVAETETEAPEPAERVAEARPAPAAPERDRAVRLSASELLARANGARREGDYDGALRWYQTLQRTYPSSRETAVSRVTLGRLYLDGLAEPGRALSQFERYLAEQPGGVLAEEARVGRALALGRLGRTAEERDAWRALLRHHPDSLHAERARARLQ